MTEGKKRKRLEWFYYFLPLAGTVFVLWYIHTAAYDMAYSDYIRQILSYLPDVWNPEKFFVADILTRIPINFPVRAFNVNVLGFSVIFDLILGGLGLGLASLVLADYGRRRKLGIVWFVLLMLLFFSLNKWEMLTNGTGWVHFFAFACFYYHYILFDRMERGEGKRRDGLKLIVLPFFITLGTAGPYCAVYTGVMLLAYGFAAGRKKALQGIWDKRYLKYGIALLVPLCLYLWSSSYGITEHAGAYEGPMLPVLLEQPELFGKFFIKSFAGMVFGHEAFEELVNRGIMPYATVYLLGLAVIGGYLLALYLNFRYRLYEKTILPLILLAAGGMNHVLILLSRWIFLRDSYGMSSRYALQFQVGILGIVLTLGLLWDKLSGWNRKVQTIKALAVLWCLVVLVGNIYTTYREIKIAPNRKEWGRTVAEMALHYEDFDDDELKQWFQYRSGEKIRQALSILKENHLNVYRD
ncbi:hypothetical protein AALB16_14370 [Lachnospiraceae bacterium 62-35]